jgi:hypothetical protein
MTKKVPLLLHYLILKKSVSSSSLCNSHSKMDTYICSSFNNYQKSIYIYTSPSLQPPLKANHSSFKVHVPDTASYIRG